MSFVKLKSMIGWLVGLRAATHETELGDQDFYLSREEHEDEEGTFENTHGHETHIHQKLSME